MGNNPGATPGIPHNTGAECGVCALGSPLRLRSASDTMKLHIEHATAFIYAQSVREAVGEARLCPRNHDGQRLLSFRLALDPPNAA